jgi:Uma2 family endonuclease
MLRSGPSAMANNDTSTALQYEPAPEPDVSRLVTEDGAAVDNWASEKTQRLLTSILYDSWRAPDSVPFVAAANVALYSAIHRPPVVPDVMVSLEAEVPAGWWEKRSRCYFTWEFGKPPELAIEIVSDRGGLELSAKLRQYARASVTYYVVFDPQRQLSDQVLQSFALTAGQYEELDRHWYERVGLGLALWQGNFEGREDSWLRWVDASGAWIPTGAERAERERSRAERLAAQLRALGIDPE